MISSHHSEERDNKIVIRQSLFRVEKSNTIQFMIKVIIKTIHLFIKTFAGLPKSQKECVWHGRETELMVKCRQGTIFSLASIHLLLGE